MDRKYSGISAYSEQGALPIVFCEESGGSRQVLSITRSRAVWDLSPSGFNWGAESAGAAQLALALLLEESDQGTAVTHYQDFQRQVVAKWPAGQPWAITGDDIKRWLAARKA